MLVRSRTTARNYLTSQSIIKVTNKKGSKEHFNQSEV